MPPYGKRKGKGKGKGKSKGKGKGRVPGELQKSIYRLIHQGIRQGLAKVTKQFNKPRKGRGKGKTKSEEDRKAFLEAQKERNEAHNDTSVDPKQQYISRLSKTCVYKAGHGVSSCSLWSMPSEHGASSWGIIMGHLYRFMGHHHLEHEHAQTAT